MQAHRRVKDKDEELAYRDTSFRPRPHAATSTQLFQVWRWPKRRLVAVIGGILFLYFFLRIILPDGEGSNLLPTGSSSSLGFTGFKLPSDAPRTDVVVDEEQRKHYYEGRIRYYDLASSLHGIKKTQGTKQSNRNVLFAASSLKSVANLMPLACAMGKWDRNFVHFAVLGRDPMVVEEILYINGVDDKECRIFMHDGRSDHSEYSTDRRARIAVAGAMKHINDFMHPQAVIIDDAKVEDETFSEALRAWAEDNPERAVIEIPKGKYEDFTWITKLDSGSLSSWYLPTIDILIHAPRQGSGGLLRAIKSLQDADYRGLKPPRLTIELPPDVDSFTSGQLDFLNWPPDKHASPLKTNTLALRHRIPSSLMTREDASLRFVESFYPTQSYDNHVLVLSSQVELSRSYFQFLYYTILEYRYSSYGAADIDDLLGVSLDVPDILVNGRDRLVVPKAADMNSKRYLEDRSLDKSIPVPFLYGAPTSTASLFFGDKWTMLHSFLKLRLASTHEGVAQKFERLVTKAEPVWMEYFLELIRTKGWFMLHPASAFATVHNELAQIPEENMRLGKADREKDDDSEDTDEDDDDEEEEDAFLTTPDPPQIPDRDEKDRREIHPPLHLMLPFDGDMPELPHLPYVDHLGVIKTSDEPKLTRMEYATLFRQKIGGCSAEDAARPRQVPLLTADDLFCLPDMDIEFRDEEKPESEGRDEGDEKDGAKPEGADESSSAEREPEKLERSEPQEVEDAREDTEDAAEGPDGDGPDVRG